MRRHYSARFLLFVLLSACAVGRAPAEPRPSTTSSVEVDVYLMASCPFAQKALSGLLPVVEKLGDAVHMRVHHIGGVKASGELDSMYGEEDLSAGRLQVCAQELAGESGLRSVLACQLRDDKQAVDECLATAAVDRAALERCAHGASGQALLRASFDASRAAKVRESPTIIVNGHVYESGQSQTHFARALCAEPGHESWSACKHVPAPVAVDVTLVKDPNCASATCPESKLARFLEHTFAGVRLKVLAPSDAAAQALRTKAGEPPLPFAVLGAEAAKDSFGFPIVAQHVKQIAGDARFLLSATETPLPAGVAPSVAN